MIYSHYPTTLEPSPMKNTGYICFDNQSPRRTGYTRLSKKELEGRDTVNRHIQQLKEAGCSEVYWDIISRSSKKRVGLSAVIKLLQDKATTEVVLIRLDRLTDSHELMEEFINIVLNSNISCRSIHDSIDLTTVGGRTHARLLVTLSRNEIERTSERFKDGWEGVRRRNKAVQPPFGYKVESNKHKLDHQPMLCLLETREEISKAEIAKQIVDEFLKVKSLRGCVRSINQIYGLWHSNHNGSKAGFSAGGLFQLSTTGLKYWLTSPVLQGHLIYFRGTDKEAITYNTHLDEVLITPEQYEEIQLIVEHNKTVRGWGVSKGRYPLTGLIFCQECGGNCHSLTGGKRNGREREYYYYYCKNANLSACSSKGLVRMDSAEQVVIASLMSKAKEISEFVTPAITTKSTELILREEELRRYSDLPNHPEIEALRQRLRLQIEVLSMTGERKDHYTDELKKLVQEAFSDADFFYSRTEEYRKDIYQHLVKKVVLGQEFYEVTTRTKEKKLKQRGVVVSVELKI